MGRPSAEQRPGRVTVAGLTVHPGDLLRGGSVNFTNGVTDPARAARGSTTYAPGLLRSPHRGMIVLLDRNFAAASA
jgi:hypothetical protein